MATPRKNQVDKVRDSEVSKRKLIDSVGEIVRTAGFHELGVNKIAQLAERDKGLIRYHFKGLNNLLRAYIQEKDYWPPFFERYQISEDADQGEVKRLFIALMQENLKQFYAAKEMQKIILWQITSSSALLRNVSEAREAEGEKLFKLTQESFLKSGVNFKAVIALLLGGTYFAVLQAHAIKTKVCGMDLNWGHDLKEMEKTIGQIITWAYEKANLANQSSTIPMNYELEHLEKLTAELADHVQEEDYERQTADNLLAIEAQTVERILTQHLLTLTNETQIVTFLQVYLGRLTKLCNKLYRPQAEANPDAEVLLELIESVRSPVPQYVPEQVVVPELFRDQQAKEFQRQWRAVLEVLTENGIAEPLLGMVEIPLRQFVTSIEPMRWCDVKYLKRYLEVLAELPGDQLTEDLLLTRLVGLGYNHSRFTAYYTSRITERLKGLAYEQARNLLKSELARLSQLSIYTKREFDSRKLPVLEELTEWINAELVRNEEQKTGVNPFKLLSKFKAVQLAFWKKLEYDHGVYEEDNLDVFSEKIVHNYSTKGQEDLSALSMKSKFYPKDRAIFKAIEQLLMAMLEDVRKFL